MPHVVLNGNIGVENVFTALKPLFFRNGTDILRTSESYLEREKNAILVDSLSIQRDKKIGFLLMISGREDGIVIRLYPKSEVEKTEGVKRLIAEIAKQLLQTFPELRRGETNLSEYFR